MKREEEGKFHIRWIELSKIPGKKSNRIKMESKEGKKKKKKKKKIDRRSSIIGMKTSSSMLRFIDLLRLIRKKNIELPGDKSNHPSWFSSFLVR